MKAITFLLFCSLAVPALAQSAVVQPLTDSEATRSKQLYDAREAATKAVDDWNKEIDKKYLQSPKADADHNIMHGGCISVGCNDPNSYWTKTGWGNGFQYDKTFHFIVPNEVKSSPTSCGIWGLNCGGTTWSTTPAPFVGPAGVLFGGTVDPPIQTINYGLEWW